METRMYKSIYVLTTGSYSDYMIIGVYSTIEYAEEAMRRYDLLNPYDGSEIEEFILDNMPIEGTEDE
jgi:hypothetical protein